MTFRFFLGLFFRVSFLVEFFFGGFIVVVSLKSVTIITISNFFDDNSIKTFQIFSWRGGLFVILSEG